MHPVVTTPGGRLRIIQRHDPFKQWWSLDELRFCRKCEHLIIGRDIRILRDENDEYHFRCPTDECEGGWTEWEYPELHL
jgi:hypothetical protein